MCIRDRTGVGQNQTTMGPILDASRTMVLGIYQKAFTYMEMGPAAAESVFLFAIILLITLLDLKMEKKWVFYN